MGLPFLGVVLYVMYLFVGVLGAGTAVDWLERGVFGKDLASLSLAAAPDGSLAPAGAPPGRGQRLALMESTAQEGGGVRLRVSAQTQADGVWEQNAGEPLRFFAVPRSGSFDPVRETSPGIYETTYRPGLSPISRIEVHDWSGFINPWLHAFFMTFVPWEIVRDAFVGTYGLVTMGATYAIAIVLPIVATFFFAFSILEDSGYLPRLAIMVNKVFRLMGLNGKAVLPMVLGLGCDTMATLTTRILETKKERTIVIILLALGVPCSAQLGVIVGMLAGLSWKAAAIWSGVLAGVILLVGYLSSKLLPGRGSDFIMEIPPIRVPAFANIATKTMARIEWYVKEAVPLFLLGTLLLFAADRLNLLRAAEGVFSPLITGVLGLPRQATEAFIIGFLRRDFGSAGLYRLADAGLLDPVQVVVSLVTVTLFIPCIANFFMIVKEKGMTAALLIAGFIFPFAVLVGGTLNYILRAMKVSL
jgi:ferrous iron transport protein B